VDDDSTDVEEGTTLVAAVTEKHVFLASVGASQLLQLAATSSLPARHSQVALHPGVVVVTMTPSGMADFA